jgi:hypothetical protein
MGPQLTTGNWEPLARDEKPQTWWFSGTPYRDRHTKAALTT